MILGGGPAGIEAALAAHLAGIPFMLLEASKVGASIRRWAHVRMFSPWKINTSPAGRSFLEEGGTELPDASLVPTGGEYLDEYLLPLSRSRELASSIREGTRARAIHRRGLGKFDLLGKPERAEHPFRIMWESTGDARTRGSGVIESRWLVDATGVYHSPLPLGAGGTPASGENAEDARVTHYIPDLGGYDREMYGEGTTLLIGGGYSAATVVRDFAHLVFPHLESTVVDGGSAQVVWALKSPEGTPAVRPIENDSLAERAALTKTANELAARPPEFLRVIRGVQVGAISEDGGRLRVEWETRSGSDRPDPVTVDRVLALTGYRPELALLSELQVHLCYATDGLMNVSAALLGAAGGGGDCLAVPTPGLDTLKNPEPGLFVIGSKSYGRSSVYLMKSGVDQVELIFRHLEEERAP